MPLYCSNTGSTALREAEVQQPITAAHLSLTSSFLAFSAKVGQSLAPSSWMNLILRPSTPPAALICSIASFSASTEPVSEIAIVPVTECRMPTVTSVSVTASPVVLTAEVAGTSAKDGRGSIAMAGSAAIPISSLRRSGDFRPCLISSDMSTPFWFEETRLLVRRGLLEFVQLHRYARSRILHRKIRDVGFGTGLARDFGSDRRRVQELTEVAGRQRIDRVRRQYNQWVANQTLEDYALRFTAKSARRWSAARVANTALGAISFLALEAIGGTITLNYGVTNAAAAILVVSVIIFCCGLPIAYHAAKYGIDIDLLTRGAGFGYIGSTITSLIYASFTFIFFAIEAAIMALALEMCFGIPRPIGYLISAVVDHSAGDPRHHADQPLPALDAAALDRPAHPAVRRDRLRQSALVRGVDAVRRRAWRSRRPSRPAAVRHRGLGGVLAGGADRRAGRLPALPAARPPDRRRRPGGSRCSAPGPAGSCSARSSCWPARSWPSSR